MKAAVGGAGKGDGGRFVETGDGTGRESQEVRAVLINKARLLGVPREDAGYGDQLRAGPISESVSPTSSQRQNKPDFRLAIFSYEVCLLLLGL